MDWQALVVLAAQGVLIFFLIQELRELLTSRELRRDVRSVVVGVGVRHLLMAPLVLSLVMGTYHALSSAHPVFRVGWASLLGSDGGGVLTTTLGWGSWFGVIIGVALGALVLVLMPLLVLGEEGLFRSGDEARGVPRRVLQAVAFGLCHLVAGIPLGLALGLTWGGLYLSREYTKSYRHAEGDAKTKELRGLYGSASAHLAYNVGIVLLALVLVLSGW